MNERYYEFYLNWIKEEREKQNISLEDFAYLCKYSKTSISKIENHKVQADEATFKLFFKRLKLHFIFNDKQYKLHNQWLEELYEALVFHNLDVAEDRLDKIEENKEAFLFSELFFKYYLYRYAWYTVKRKREDAQEIQKLIKEKFLPYIELSKQEKQVYLDYLGVNLCIQNKYEESIATLTEAMNVTKDSITYGMICYHIGISYGYIGNLIDEVYYDKIAMSMFIRDLNFSRLLYVQVHIANVYSKMGMYSLANETYQKILKKSDLLNNDYLIKTIQGNMNSLLMKQENYCEAIGNITQSFLERGSVSDADYFNIVFCYYKLEDYENLKKWMLVIKKAELRNPDIFREIDIIDKVTDMEKNNVVIKYLKAEYKQNKKECSCEERELYLQLLVDFHEKDHKYKDALYYYKMLHH